MKKKKSDLKTNELPSSSLSNDHTEGLNSASTYSSDMQLFQSLGLKTYKGIPTGIKHFVGKVKFSNGSYVKIWVIPAPALFWKFEIFVVGSKKTTNVSTGSGALHKFWNAIKLIAEDMLDVENTEFKK